MPSDLVWYVSHPRITDTYGAPLSGSGDSPESALDALVSKCRWELQLWTEKAALLSEVVQTPEGKAA